MYGGSTESDSGPDAPIRGIGNADHAHSAPPPDIHISFQVRMAYCTLIYGLCPAAPSQAGSIPITITPVQHFCHILTLLTAMPLCLGSCGQVGYHLSLAFQKSLLSACSSAVVLCPTRWHTHQPSHSSSSPAKAFVLDCLERSRSYPRRRHSGSGRKLSRQPSRHTV
jgi:hypothetical protein